MSHSTGVETGPEELLPPSMRKDLATLDSTLWQQITVWLKKHGKGVRPKLTGEQRQQLQECFRLMDQDGSGAIDADELFSAFKLLGIRMKREEIRELCAEVDHDGSGEVEYGEFEEIMTTTLQRLADDESSKGMSENQLHFSVQATAYRRKRLMEGIISGEKDVQAQISAMQDARNEAVLQELKAAEEQARKDKEEGKHNEHKAGAHKQRFCLPALPQSALAALSAEERQLINALFSKQHQQSHPPGKRKLPDFRQQQQPWARGSLDHQLLMDTPQALDLHFSRPTIKLPACKSAASCTPHVSLPLLFNSRRPSPSPPPPKRHTTAGTASGSAGVMVAPLGSGGGYARSLSASLSVNGAHAMRSAHLQSLK